VRNIREYVKCILYALFLPTWFIYVVNGYLSGFSEKIYMLITVVLSFFLDVMWGRGFFFFLYGSFLVYAEAYNSSIVSSLSLYMLFSLLWFLVLWLRGFPLWFILFVGLIWLWEVFSYEREKRVLY